MLRRVVPLTCVLSLVLSASGCIGILGGYLTESPARFAGSPQWEEMTPEKRNEARAIVRMRNGPFPAVSTDFFVLDNLLDESSNPFLDAYAIVLIGIDLPFSAVFDTLMLPVKLTAYAIHGYPLPSSLPPEPSTTAPSIDPPTRRADNIPPP